VYGVVVFGGPPCKKFCNASSHVLKQRAILPTAKAHLDKAESHLKMLKVVGNLPEKVVSGEELAEAKSQVAKALQLYRAAANAVAIDDAGLRAAEDLVTSFLNLFQDIQMHCTAAGNVPCHLVMENPYSSADRALWNRCGHQLRPATHALLVQSHQVG
jgi:hypothetical protein